LIPESVIDKDLVLKVNSMKELRWLREEPKSPVFLFLFFLFFLSYFKFCFWLRPKAEAISTKIACIPKDMAATNFHPVQPIVKAVETVGEKPLV